jgi:hypothetical protein
MTTSCCHRMQRTRKTSRLWWTQWKIGTRRRRATFKTSCKPTWLSVWTSTTTLLSSSSQDSPVEVAVARAHSTRHSNLLEEPIQGPNLSTKTNRSWMRHRLCSIKQEVISLSRIPISNTITTLQAWRAWIKQVWALCKRNRAKGQTQTTSAIERLILNLWRRNNSLQKIRRWWLLLTNWAVSTQATRTFLLAHLSWIKILDSWWEGSLLTKHLII